MRCFPYLARSGLRLAARLFTGPAAEPALCLAQGLDRLGTRAGRGGLLLGALLIAALPAWGRDLWTSDAGEEAGVWKLDTAFKATGLDAAPPSGSDPFSAGGTNVGLLRLRLDTSYRSGAWTFDAAYDNRWASSTGLSLGLSSALPANTPAPFRISQVGGVAARSGNTVDYYELDRAFAAHNGKSVDVTVGRQAIGWGRGVLFSAVDIFAPFAPLQVDQEWRRGVDAANVDVKLSDTSSAQVVSAFGPNWDQSALGARLRGYLGSIDAEILVAKRAEDTMYGLTSSAALGNAEVHGEFAVFQTPGDVPDTGFGGNPSLVPKAVLGVSNNFLWGNGLKVAAEYHYSGFGAASPSGMAALLANPAFQKRLIRGDTQILGRQALGMQASSQFNTSWSGSLLLLQSLIDPSGVVVPAAVWDLSDSVSLLGTMFQSYGAGLHRQAFQSQFGYVPTTVILQLRVYD